MKALLDSDVLLDFLDGFAGAGREIARYDHCFISIISWMEVMAGAKTPADEETRRAFLHHFELLPLTADVADKAVAIRRSARLKLPDAIIWATAKSASALLVSRNTKDFPSGQPGIRFPYRR